MNNLFSLEGKTAIVTGGNGGIGTAMAEGLASAGSDIIIAARNQKTAEATANDIKKKYGVKTKAIIVDVRKEDEIIAAVDQIYKAFSKIDILINVAGMNVRKFVQDIDITEWDAVNETNARGGFLFCKAIYPKMKAAGGGKIINIGSMMSLFGGSFVAPYAASKGAIVQLTKCLACAYAPDNIQVNAILPGYFDTPLTRQGRKDIEGLEESVTERTPMKRWGKPEELAGTAIYLASEASHFMTGASIVVDGGWSIMM